jgi:hypothetical protein
MDFLLPIAEPRMIIWADRNGPRPEKPYFTIKVRGTSSAKLVETPPDANGVATFREHRLIRCEVACFGKDAIALAQTLSVRMRLPSQTLRAEQCGISLASVEDVRDLTALLNASQREERALLEFTGYALGEVADNVGLIEHVVLECPVGGGTGHQHVISMPDAATPPPSP